MLGKRAQYLGLRGGHPALTDPDYHGPAPIELDVYGTASRNPSNCRTVISSPSAPKFATSDNYQSSESKPRRAASDDAGGQR